MAFIGFPGPYTIREKESEVTDLETGRVVTHRTFVVSAGGAFASLMMALGMPHGRRTEQEMPEVPAWVIQGSKLVIREWLGGIHGGDGGALPSAGT